VLLIDLLCRLENLNPYPIGLLTLGLLGYDSFQYLQVHLSIVKIVHLDLCLSHEHKGSLVLLILLKHLATNVQDILILLLVKKLLDLLHLSLHICTSLQFDLI
jgi:hypothetical protein